MGVVAAPPIFMIPNVVATLMWLDVIGSDDRIRINNIICLARTYRKHAEELGNVVPDEPVVFLKPNSAAIANGESIVVPDDIGAVHHEVELGVVIGLEGHKIPEERALDHVLGYNVVLDLTARDIQSQLKEKRLPWARAKGFDTFAPMSAVRSKAEIEDPHNLGVRCTVAGEVRQDSNTSYMIFTIPQMIAYISNFMTLQRGDVIATGTPEGVGPIVPGNRIVGEIEGVGRLECPVDRE